MKADAAEAAEIKHLQSLGTHFVQRCDASGETEYQHEVARQQFEHRLAPSSPPRTGLAGLARAASDPDQADLESPSPLTGLNALQEEAERRFWMPRIRRD